MTPESPLDGWLRSAIEDAERRGLPELKPLFEALARATAGLRAAERADADRDAVAGAAARLRAARFGAQARGAPEGPPHGRPAGPDEHASGGTAGAARSAMTDPRTIAAVAPRIRAGEISPLDLVRECLARIEASRALNAFITVFEDRALEEARDAEREIRGGGWRGPLHGVPISLKDLIDVAGSETTSGSRVPPRQPRADALLVQRLREAGAILIGKTNLHEFAFGTTGDESGYGPIRHPLDPDRSAGGSSSGAAVAVVEGMALASIGTDTGGSVRIPAAACGCVGLKPTFGELSCEGVVPLSTTLDHVGPLARTVADAALVFDAMRGAPPRVPSPRDGHLALGVPGPHFCDRLDPGVRGALDHARRALEQAGHAVRDVRVEHAEWTPDVYLHIVLPEASWYHATTIERHPEGYSPGVRLRLEMGRYVLAEDYVRARRLRHTLRAGVDRALEGLDALLLPALAIPAPPLFAASVDVDGHKEPVRAVMLKLTQLFNITGHPAIALPAGLAADTFPVGLQLVGRHHQTADLLAVAAALEPHLR
jgi:aspartyl-tRNA(Asn)/glutamyl-tRNA(Gln) amidotransferase subunit A